MIHKKCFVIVHCSDETVTIMELCFYDCQHAVTYINFNGNNEFNAPRNVLGMMVVTLRVDNDTGLDVILFLVI